MLRSLAGMPSWRLMSETWHTALLNRLATHRTRIMLRRALSFPVQLPKRAHAPPEPTWQRRARRPAERRRAAHAAIVLRLVAQNTSVPLLRRLARSRRPRPRVPAMARAGSTRSRGVAARRRSSTRPSSLKPQLPAPTNARRSCTGASTEAIHSVVGARSAPRRGRASTERCRRPARSGMSDAVRRCPRARLLLLVERTAPRPRAPAAPRA